MHGETPEFRRCCFCLPLRRGLIGWGYFRLTIDVLAIIRFLVMFIHMSFMINYIEIMIITAVITYYIIDAVFAIFLIVGGHKKSHKLLRISYIYCIVWLALILILGGLLVYSEIFWMLRREKLYPSSFENIALDLSITFVVIFVQVYLMLLTRSEEIKLRTESLGVQFVNNAADAESICVRMGN